MSTTNSETIRISDFFSGEYNLIPLSAYIQDALFSQMFSKIFDMGSQALFAGLFVIVPRRFDEGIGTNDATGMGQEGFEQSGLFTGKGDFPIALKKSVLMGIEADLFGDSDECTREE